MKMFHAEMLVDKKIINLGDYLADDKNAIGIAWRRALLVANSSPTKVVSWKHGKQEPHWWTDIKSNISLEEKAASLRGSLRKKTNTENEIEELKTELKSIDAQLKKIKKSSRKKTVVVEKTTVDIKQQN